MRHGILALAIVAGLFLNHFVLSEHKENRRAESVQKLQVGDASYELLFHRGVNFNDLPTFGNPLLGEGLLLQPYAALDYGRVFATDAAAGQAARAVDDG